MQTSIVGQRKEDKYRSEKFTYFVDDREERIDDKSKVK